MKFSESLKKSKDFQNVYNKGNSYANRLLVMYVLENHTDKNRLGISVSKKVGNSVIRHHLTRLIREGYRLQEDMFNSGLDIVVIARGTARDASFHQISRTETSWRSSQNNTLIWKRRWNSIEKITYCMY
jgi:ribonuclease P protein component